jgi:hypothetical protein
MGKDRRKREGVKVGAGEKAKTKQKQRNQPYLSQFLYFLLPTCYLPFLSTYREKKEN